VTHHSPTRRVDHQPSVRYADHHQPTVRTTDHHQPRVSTTVHHQPTIRTTDQHQPRVSYIGDHSNYTEHSNRGDGCYVKLTVKSAEFHEDADGGLRRDPHTGQVYGNN